MTDTHTHLYMTDSYSDGGELAVKSAIEAGVKRMVFPCVNLDSLKPMRELNARFPDNTRMAIGLHPTDVTDDWESQLERMESLLPGDFAAVGEVGIDLYHDKSHLKWQREAFARQIGWASRHSLPVIIHCREGLDDTLDIIGSVTGPLPPLVFHSFTGSVDDVRRIREVCDPWFGINGVVTFKNAPALREALPEIGLGRILLETDAPWLSPVPYRGQLNESARIPFIRDKVAEVLEVAHQTVEKVTDDSAAKLFRFDI